MVVYILEIKVIFYELLVLMDRHTSLAYGKLYQSPFK